MLPRFLCSPVRVVACSLFLHACCRALSPGQTDATCCMQHCWIMLEHVKQDWPNERNIVQYGGQTHATCCVCTNMLHPFGHGFMCSLARVVARSVFLARVAACYNHVFHHYACALVSCVAAHCRSADTAGPGTHWVSRMVCLPSCSSSENVNHHQVLAFWKLSFIFIRFAKVEDIRELWEAQGLEDALSLLEVENLTE